MPLKYAKLLFLFLVILLFASLLGSLLIPIPSLSHTLSIITLISTSLAILSGMYYWGSTLRTIEQFTDEAEKITREDFSQAKWEKMDESLGGHEEVQQAILELKNKVQSLTQERDYFHAILEGMREGLIVTDSQGKIITANPAWYHLISPSTRCEGKTVLEAIRNHEIHDLLVKSLSLNQSMEKEVTLRRQDQERNLLIFISPLTNLRKEKSAIAVFLDVSQLRKLEKSRQHFVGNVSHELKTPLTIIRGYAETLRSRALKDKEKADLFLSKIENNAQQLQNLIEDLLRISELESGRVEFKPKPLAILNFLEGIQKEFQETFKTKNLDFHLKIQEDFSVLVEASSLKQILINLISNAIKYTSPGGKITLEAFTKDQLGHFVITDTGMGIPEKDLPHIFERFYRVDPARSREMGGTGLGLAIVKHLVQTQGGEVGARSRLNQGSEFFFKLPLAPRVSKKTNNFI